LQQLGEGTERDALAAEVFGGSAKELGPLLNTAAENVAAMRQEVNDLGGVMSDDAVKGAAAFQDSVQNLQTAIGGIKKAFISDFLPAATSISDSLTKIFSGDTTEGLKDIKKGVSDLVKTLSDKAPEIIEIGWNIVDGLITAINDNLPTLIQKGADLLLNGIIPGIIEQLPMLVETAFSIIGQLVTSIGQALPELIPAAVDMILQIVESLLDNIDLLVDAAIALILGLAEGLIRAIPKLIEKAPTIVIKLVEAIIRNVPKILEAGWELIKMLVQGIGEALGSLWEAGKDIVNKVGEGIASLWEKAKSWGRDLIENFGKGITEKAQALLQKVKDIASGIKKFLGFSEPEEGPLSDFHTYAPDMMNLFMKGITDNKRRLQNTVADAFDFGDSFTAPTARPAFAAAGAVAGAGGNGFGGNIALYIDGDKLVGATSRRMDRDLGNMQQLKARWGGRN
jgi:phage-related protein